MPITPLPSLRQLRYLLALHEHGHFGRAAEACFVTQSTLSTGLAELERLLEARLVERSKRSLRFTAVGEEVVARARDVIRAAEDLRTAAQGAQEPLVGAMRMAAIPTVAPFLLPAIVARVADRWPRLRLFVREMLTGAACEALHRGVMDCALIALPADCGEVESCEIMVDRLLLVAPAGAEAAGDADSPAGVDPTQLLLLDEGHCLRDHALAACNLDEAAPESRLVASTLHTLVRMVDAGLGVTLLPEMAVSAGLLDGARVTGRTLSVPGAERRIALVWRRRNPRAADLRLLGATLREATGTAPA